MKQFLLICILIVAGHCSFAQLRYTKTVFNEVDTLKDVEFAQSDWLNNMVSLLAEYNIHSGENKSESRPLFMDIYTPKNDSVSKRPAILFGFSGGFLIGSRHNEDMIAFCDSFARRGYVTANYDYRIGMGANVSTFLGIPYAVSVSEKNGARAVYRAIQDSRAAIRFLKSRADEFGIDTTKIYLVGSSAGGFVALHNFYMDKPSEIPEFALQAPSLGNLDTVGVQGFGGRANAIVSMWGALQTPDLIEDEQGPALLIHGEDDDVVYFKKGVPLKSLIPEMDGLNFDIPETYGGYCIDTALINRNIPHSTYFVPGKKHEFYGVKTGDFGDDGPNQYWDTIQSKISDFLYDIFKPEAEFEDFNIERDVSFSNTSSTKHYALWDFGDGIFSNEINPVHRFEENGYHTITLTACNENMACDTLTKEIFLNPLSISEDVLSKISIFPNPVKDELNIQGIKPGFTVKVIDVTGRTQIQIGTCYSNSIRVSNIQTGIYILQIKTLSGTTTRKFQKIE